MTREKFDWSLLALKVEGRQEEAAGCGRPPEAVKDAFSPESPERSGACLHPDFSPVRAILDFRVPELYDNNFVFKLLNLLLVLVATGKYYSVNEWDCSVM